jgi:mRNA interferase MazF
VWWVDLGVPRGSAPALRRPAVVVQSDRFNESRIETVIVLAMTTNLRLAAMPGNVPVMTAVSGLPHDSVVNVTQVVTVDKENLLERIGTLPSAVIEEVEAGLRLVLAL